MCVIVAAKWPEGTIEPAQGERQVIFKRIIEYAKYDFENKSVTITADLFLNNDTDAAPELLLMQRGAIKLDSATGCLIEEAKKQESRTSRTPSSEISLLERTLAHHEDFSLSCDGMNCANDEPESYRFLSDCLETPELLSPDVSDRPFTVYSLGNLKPNTTGVYRVKISQDGKSYFEQFCGNTPYYTKIGAELLLTIIENEYIPEIMNDNLRHDFQNELDSFRRLYARSATPRIYEIAFYADSRKELPNLATLPFEFKVLKPTSKTKKSMQDTTLWLRTPKADEYFVHGELVSGNFALSSC